MERKDIYNKVKDYIDTLNVERSIVESLKLGEYIKDNRFKGKRLSYIYLDDNNSLVENYFLKVEIPFKCQLNYNKDNFSDYIDFEFSILTDVICYMVDDYGEVIISKIEDSNYRIKDNNIKIIKLESSHDLVLHERSDVLNIDAFINYIDELKLYGKDGEDKVETDKEIENNKQKYKQVLFKQIVQLHNLEDIHLDNPQYNNKLFNYLNNHYKYRHYNKEILSFNLIKEDNGDELILLIIRKEKGYIIYYKFLNSSKYFKLILGYYKDNKLIMKRTVSERFPYGYRDLYKVE